MPKNLENKLVIAISSRALFDLNASHTIFEAEGVTAYANHQIQHENDILEPGVAFPLVKKLLALNTGNDTPLVEVLLLSRNSADTGLRVFNSIQHYQLDITRAAFTSGSSPYAYVSAFGSHLFLSANPDDVERALHAGQAAATIIGQSQETNNDNELRIAFDGDSVLFSDEAERVYQQEGFEAFAKSEAQSAETPLEGGPFKPFLSALHRVQKAFPKESCPVRTALVTARSAPAHERVIKTLRAWGIRIDEALFLGGLSKGDFLKAFQADFFFDDQPHNCVSAREVDIASGHVPHGIINKTKNK